MQKAGRLIFKEGGTYTYSWVLKFNNSLSSFPSSRFSHPAASSLS
jgi:hypothetical protein